ncbi:PD-(D/E)XK nuclease-like domain-containing protein [Microbacterium trichothecenolyticum]|uniref:Exodeoxyribonuclease 8 n=1 Tax=Microbacterium trichothecenolyticum TaxID=69370 RepID=A0A0M2HG29_MICTR|nr:PD-(D/E)XK nuclease-like domain-containing protein [Microbacterium trichothecenolyticum]KJL45606.1 Exodeoxyribonuclease 8 [Microbacterium trichothecenolyticum]
MTSSGSDLVRVDEDIVDAEIVEEDELAVFGSPDDWHGIIHGLPEEAYHAHPSLSSTQVKWLLDSPARYRYNLTHPQPYKKAFDEGSALHALVLGTGWEVVTIPADLLSGANKAIASAEAKAWVANARDNNQIPLKAHEVAKVEAIAEAVLADPDVIAEGLLTGGRPEVSVFAHDADTGVDTRCRFDYLADDLSFAVDLKSGTSVTKAGFSKAVADWGYDVSHEHYLDTLEIVTGIRPPKFYIAVEKEPPYFTAVFRLSDDEIEMGRKEARAARRQLAACRMADYWPHRRLGIQTTEAPMRRIYDHIDRFKEIAS